MTSMARRLGGLWLAGVVTATAMGATEVRFFRQQSAEDFVDGEFDGLALDAEGALRPAPHFERLAEVAEPFVFVARAGGGGWVAGTGNDGRVVGISEAGEVRTLWKAPEPEVFALWVDPDGTILVGTSPRGKVYRLEAEGGREVFDPEESYIWALARAPWGDLLVATGDGARLYAVGSDGAARLLFESDEDHLRSLYPLADSVLVGTAGEGRILSVDAAGRVRTLFDADQAEVTAFAADPGGGWYAAAVAQEASLTQRAKEAGGDSKAGDEGEVSIEVEMEPAKAGTEDRSVVIRGGAGEAAAVASLERETIYSLAWIDGRPWIGTGAEGNVYSLNDGHLTLETSVADRQVVAMFGGALPALVTTNGAAVHRASAATSPGRFVSEVLDAGAVSRFGTLAWRGEAARHEAVKFAVRTGLSARPDATWSDWSLAAAGDALDLGAAPPGRFVQWRVEVSPAAGKGARITSVTLSYRQRNVAPTIESFAALDPGQVLTPTSFDPGDQIYEPAHPDRAGIFTTLEPSKANGGRLKTLWRHGYLTLKWDAEDANDDELRYSLGVRGEGSAGEFIAMADEIEEAYYSFDATVLPDGVYRFRLRASDHQANAAGTALSGERLSEPIVVDHTPPAVLSRTEEGGTIRVVVGDDWSPLRAAEVSRDGGPWEEAVAEDGLVDGRRETLLLAPRAAAALVLLRLTDAAFNVATYEVGEAEEAH